MPRLQNDSHRLDDIHYAELSDLAGFHATADEREWWVIIYIVLRFKRFIIRLSKKEKNSVNKKNYEAAGEIYLSPVKCIVCNEKSGTDGTVARCPVSKVSFVGWIVFLRVQSSSNTLPVKSFRPHYTHFDKKLYLIGTISRMSNRIFPLNFHKNFHLYLNFLSSFHGAHLRHKVCMRAYVIVLLWSSCANMF